VTVPPLRTSRLLAAALAAFPAGARAQAAAAPQAAAPPRALVLVAENRTAAQAAARGAPRGDARARPGDVLRYRLTFTNLTPRPSHAVRLDNAVPAGLRYVGGSTRASRGDVLAEYSADGGRSWSARPADTVQVAGRAVPREVPAERYTHVRWQVPGPVAPRAAVVVEYDLRVAAAAPDARPGAR
jgi:uncharacterized repeat protein (TIGR01451 family)